MLPLLKVGYLGVEPYEAMTQEECITLHEVDQEDDLDSWWNRDDMEKRNTPHQPKKNELNKKRSWKQKNLPIFEN